MTLEELKVAVETACENSEPSDTEVQFWIGDNPIEVVEIGTFTGEEPILLFEMEHTEQPAINQKALIVQ